MAGLEQARTAGADTISIVVIRRKYFPAGFSIEAGLDIPPNEPLLFYLPYARPALVEDLAAPSDGVQIGAVSGVTVHLPGTGSLSPALNGLVASGVATIEPGKEFLVDIAHAGAREIIDLRPTLPLAFIPSRVGSHAAH